jgi:GNAT superfamily N-acetyltransferase
VRGYSGVVHFREISAADIVDAKQQISTMHPDVIIRAVSRVKQMALALRKATIVDLDQLAVMNKHLIEDESSGNPMNIEQLFARMKDWLKSGWEIDLLCQSSSVVGYALYQFRPHPYNESREEVYLRQFFVKREYRNRGYGREGIELLLSERFQGMDTVTIDVLEANPAGMRFWQKVGFLAYSTTMKRVVG